MTVDQKFTLLLSAMAIIGIPSLLFIVRATIKWTRIEDRLDQITNKLVDIVRDKDKVDQEILQQMREDRAATNTRLRWLEEKAWGKRKLNRDSLLGLFRYYWRW